jgi:hypothetical protein
MTKYTPVIFFVSAMAMLLLLFFLILSMDNNPRCYDVGRVVGGAEQRVFDARTIGADPLKSDQNTIATGAGDCK